MNLSKTVARFALAHTTDPMTAAQLADSLEDMLLSPMCATQVGFPPAWVLAKQKCPVDIAAYAVRFCRDAATLDLLAAKAKRHGVVDALLANPHLSDAGLALLAARDLGWRVNNRVVKATALRTAAPRVSLDTYLTMAEENPNLLNTNHQKEVLDLLGAPEVGTELVDRTIEQTTRQGNTWIVNNVFATTYGGGMRYGPERGLDKTSLSAIEILDFLPVTGQAKVLRKYVIDGLASLRDGSTLMGTDVAKRVLELVPISALDSSLLNGWRTGSAFTAEALDLFLVHPEWCPYLLRHTCTDEQFGTLIAGLPDELAIQMLSKDHGSRARVQQVITHLPESTVIGDSDAIEAVLSYVDGAEDPLLTFLVEHASDPMLVRYLAGQWLHNRRVFLPDIAAVRGLVERVGRDAIAGDTSRVGSRLFRSHPEYVCELAEELPGFARGNLDEPMLSEYVYNRLVGTGADMELALSQLDTCPQVGLRVLCAGITKMGRLRA